MLAKIKFVILFEKYIPGVVLVGAFADDAYTIKIKIKNLIIQQKYKGS